MTPEERQANNRKIAELLGWNTKQYGNRTWWLYDPDGNLASDSGNDIESDCWKWCPDFYRDEAANALVLDAMPEPRLSTIDRFIVKHWICVPLMANSYVYASDPDRKTAVCAAFLKLNEGERHE